MVKFSKQFQAQLVPEWKDAFVDYCQLKKELKKIQFLNSNNCSSKQPQNDSFPSAFLSCLGKVSLFGQKHRDRDTIQVLPPFLPCVCSVFQNWRDHCVLKCRFLKIFRANTSVLMLCFVGEQVHRKLASSLSKGDLYDTELLEQFTDIEAAGEFFGCLDHQLNKVNQFYKIKEKEFVERGESLKQQLDFLIELKNELKRQKDNKEASSLDPKDDPSISCYISPI